jgi:hypothetical protein
MSRTATKKAYNETSSVKLLLVNEPAIARALYKRLLRLYPRAFRERLGESMEQTFSDLYNERKRQTEQGLFKFVLWMFVETGVGIIKEHILLLAQGKAMKNIISNPTSAAITSFILSLPLGLTFAAFMFEIEPLVKPLNHLFTIEGQPGDINMLGRIVIFGGLLLLPVAFMLNLRPMLKREGPEGKPRLYELNLIVGAAILLLIIFTWGGLILEEIYCHRGIRCD